MKAATFSPWLPRVQAGICESKKLYLPLRPVLFATLGILPKTVFSICGARPHSCQTVHVALFNGEDKRLITLIIDNYNEGNDVRAKVVF